MSLNLYQKSFLVTKIQSLHFQSSNSSIDPKLVSVRLSVKEINGFNNIIIIFYPKSSLLTHTIFIFSTTASSLFPLFFHLSLYVSLLIFSHLSLTISYSTVTHFLPSFSFSAICSKSYSS
jgi:hypothetical protein